MNIAFPVFHFTNCLCRLL